MTDLLPHTPTPADVRAARLAADLTQPGMAELLGLASHRTIQSWECGRSTPMLGLWALFLLATGQHDHLRLKRAKRTA